MLFFGKTLRDYARFTRTGMILILLMGVARFVVGVSGVPYERATHLVSLTILTSLLAVVYGQRAAARRLGSYRHLLPTALTLSAAMYGFIVLAVLVEGLGGIRGYFHAPGMGLTPSGMNVATHIGGQLLAMMLTTAFLWGLASLGFLLSRHLGFLRNAFLLLAAMGVLRVLVGAAGVPYGVGTWMTSITLLGMILSVYYGFRAASKGFGGYGQAALLGVLMAAAMTLLVIYGIAVATSLGIANYFHAPGEGFQPLGMSTAQHIRGHLQFSFVGMILLGLLAGIGFALGKRKAPSPVGQGV
ncbi:MAG: hypothetical protein ACE5JI_22540 [Acidobacteriota bacterium]